MNKSLLALAVLIFTTTAQSAYLPGGFSANVLTADTIKLLTNNSAAFAKAATINAYAANPVLTQALADQMRNDMILKSNAAFHSITANYIALGMIVAVWATVGYCTFCAWRSQHRRNCANDERGILAAKENIEFDKAYTKMTIDNIDLARPRPV